MRTKLLALVATLGCALGATQPANAVIQANTWLHYIAGEVFMNHCQARNTATTDYLHWFTYDIRVCNIEATWGTPGTWTYYYDHNDETGPIQVVPVNGTSIVNHVVSIPFACPAAVFGSNRIEALNIPNQQYYPLYVYDGMGVNCGGGGMPP